MYELAKDFMVGEKKKPNPKGGRPRIYDDALILTIASIQNLHQFSFREALEFCEDYFPELPTLSPYHYRLKSFNPEIPRRFIEHIARKIKEISPGEASLFVMDGTGFSYQDVYPMRFFSGTEIRKHKAHVKAVVLMGQANKRKFVVSAKAGRAYASEIKLVEPLIPKITPGSYVLGDKGFDCIRILEKIKKKRCMAAIAIKEGRRREVRNSLRKQSRENSLNPEIYSKRTLVEGLFGNVKQKLSSHVRVFRLDIAKTFSLLRLALFNVAVLVSLEKEAYLFLRF